MRSWKRILVGLDIDSQRPQLTRGSRRALELAHWAASSNGATLTLLHSLYSEVDDAPEPRPDIEPALEQVAEPLRRDGLTVNVKLVEGRPWLALTEEALLSEQDLVVIAKRDEPPQDGRRLGLNARRLMHMCPTELWLVHPEHEHLDDPILAATDLSAVGRRAVSIASQVARRAACPLHVVHCYQIPMAMQLEHGRISEAEHRAQVESLRAKLRETILADIDASQRETVELHIGAVAPARGILEVIEVVQPDLLVMGTVSRGGVPGLLIGDTAERLIDRVDCSLLTVKPEDFISPVVPPEQK